MRKGLGSPRFVLSLLVVTLLLSSLVGGCASGTPATGTPAPAATAERPAATAAPTTAPAASTKAQESAKPAAASTSAPAAKVSSVKVGVLDAFSGPLAPIGESAKRGVELANDYINAQGGIKSMGGAKIELVYADHEGKPDLVMSQEERLAQEGVVAVLGAHTSAATIVSTQAGERLKVPQVVPLGIADAITERGFKYTFRPSVKSDWFVKDQVDFLPFLAKVKGINIKKVALLYEDTEYGQSNAAGQKKYLAKGGYDIVADLSYPAGAKDVSPIVSKLKAANPDVTVQTSYLADALLITKTMDQLGFKGIVIGAGAGHVSGDFIKGLGPLAENIFAVAMWNSDLANAQDVMKAFKAKYPSAVADQDFAIYYQSMLVLKEALEKAGKADREALRDALSKLDFTGPMLMAYERIQFGEDGQNKQEYTHNVMTQVQDGKAVTVWPEKYATAKIR